MNIEQKVEKISLLADMKIGLMTIEKVLKTKDISVRGTGKIEDFDKYRSKQNEINRK